ncbi:hypothetical protein G3I77_15710 [Streptomyces sp. D2-8]|nr:DUF192 domain-containing protein [Streptomyces sp. D2-8]MCK8434416.1 hypothetical protein [Streptomyces sp. D2-8]
MSQGAAGSPFPATRPSRYASVPATQSSWPIDAAYLDRGLRVIDVCTMRPGRLGMPRPRARHVVEAEAGVMGEWGLRKGARVEVVVARSQAHDADASSTRS